MKTGDNENWIILSLVVGSFAVYPTAFVTLLVLLDLSQSFNVSVGLVGQLQSVSSFVGMVFALILGLLTTKYSPRGLLLIGLFAITISGLGCALAPSFYVLFFAYALSGIGGAVAPSMAFTLVAEYFDEDKRSKVIGYIISGATASGVIGLPLIGYISENFGWRSAYLGYAFPLGLMGLLVSYFTLPKVQMTSKKDSSLLGGYRVVLKNSSAVASLFSVALVMIAWQGITLYSSAFFREKFLLSMNYTSVLLTLSTLVFSLTSSLSGGVVGWLGRRKIVVYNQVLSGVVILVITLVPSIYLSMFSRLVASLFVSLLYSAQSGIVLEQVPDYRGTVMSLNQAAGLLGGTIGGISGGIVLSRYGYNILGPILGVIMVFSAYIFSNYVSEKPTSASNR